MSAWGSNLFHQYCWLSPPEGVIDFVSIGGYVRLTGIPIPQLFILVSAWRSSTIHSYLKPCPPNEGIQATISETTSAWRSDSMTKYWMPLLPKWEDSSLPLMVLVLLSKWYVWSSFRMCDARLWMQSAIPSTLLPFVLSCVHLLPRWDTFNTGIFSLNSVEGYMYHGEHGM